MGPFLYGINKHVRDNPKFAMTKKMELEKIIKCSRYDFYQYKYNQNRIVCFTSLIVTSSSHIKYNPDKQEKDDKILIRMIFKYDFKKGIYLLELLLKIKKETMENIFLLILKINRLYYFLSLSLK